MDESFELVWGHGMFTEGKEYIVETRQGFYKGTYKKPEMAIPYVILYNVKKDKTKMAQCIFYREDKFYDAETYIQELKYKAQQAQQSMEKRALNEILRQLVDEKFML
jgi:predicted ATPase